MLTSINYKVSTQLATFIVYAVDDIALRESIRTIFMSCFNENGSPYMQPEGAREKLPLKRISLDLRYVHFVSRAAMDEVLCQQDRISCPIKLIHCNDDVKNMYDVVERTHR